MATGEALATSGPVVTSRALLVYSTSVLLASAVSAVALMLAGVAVRLAAPGSPLLGVPLFLSVFAAACLVGMRAAGRAVRSVLRAWDAHWDAEGRSWAVAEAERITREAVEQR